MHLPRPFKNPSYTKNVNRRAKNLKAVISQEREREKAERELGRLFKQGNIVAAAEKPQDGDAMDVDPDDGKSRVVKSKVADTQKQEEAEEIPTYTSIEAPPSIWPPKHYCDITGLEAPYTDPATGLRFHDRSIYELVKGLSTSTAKEYLSARGVSTVVK